MYPNENQGYRAFTSANELRREAMVIPASSRDRCKAGHLPARSNRSTHDAERVTSPLRQAIFLMGISIES